MKSNPLNNKYSIYYLLYEYITNTQCNIYWIIANSRVSFEMLLLLKIRVIIELFMSDPPNKNNGLVNHHATFSPLWYSCRTISFD